MSWHCGWNPLPEASSDIGDKIGGLTAGCDWATKRQGFNELCFTETTDSTTPAHPAPKSTFRHYNQFKFALSAEHLTQRLAIHLAVGIQREFFDNDDLLGRHIAR
jgi:hypothetical protein